MISRILQILQRRRHAYRMLFGVDGKGVNPAAHIVLSDLRKFCRADKSSIIVSPVTRQVDTHASAVAEGRREVWLRIQAHMNLSDADIHALTDRENREGEADV